MADLRAHGASANADVIDMAEQRRRNALFVLDILLRAYVPKNTNDWRELEAALKTLSHGVTACPESPELAALLRIWQSHLGETRAQCDEPGRKLWDRIEAALGVTGAQGAKP